MSGFATPLAPVAAVPKMISVVPRVVRPMLRAAARSSIASTAPVLRTQFLGQRLDASTARAATFGVPARRGFNVSARLQPELPAKLFSPAAAAAPPPTLPRSEVPDENRWSVETLYSDTGLWEKEFEEVCRDGQEPRWPEIEGLKGRLGEGPEVLRKAFDVSFELQRKMMKLYTYAHLRFDEEITNDKHKGMQSRIMSVFYDYGERTAWLEPEILALSQETIDRYLASAELSPYAFHLEKLVRQKPHTLSPEMEAMLSQSGKALGTAGKAFGALNDADIKFQKVKDGKGSELELSHGLFGVYLRSPDRELRKNAFNELHNRFTAYENTLCELLNGAVQSHVFGAKARKYDSCLHSALAPNNIPVSVYKSLIAAVRNGIPALHKYVSLRKKMLAKAEGADPASFELHLYDMYVNLIQDQAEMKFSWDEATKLVIDSVAPLGPEYQDALRAGLLEERWCDKYENRNKRSGAYSSGCFDSKPYILMNFQGQIQDLFTLAHECGHSMHSYLSRRNQPFHYADYSIFVAEVASTFNEALLANLMIRSAKSEAEKVYLINRRVEDIRATLFRQTMFAEFELMIHEFAEKNVPLTPSLLKEEYKKLNAFYFGKDATINEPIAIEWARIPHFYYNFYVYQYATGIAAAEYLADRVLNGGAKERDEYLSYLRGGSSKYPIDMLKVAGVDMTRAEPVEKVIGLFSKLVDDLEGLAL
eukprot:tig00021434_g21331.t1